MAIEELKYLALRSDPFIGVVKTYDSHVVPRVGIMLALEVHRERITKDTGEDELDERVEGCDEERIRKYEAVGREHPFVVD